LHVSAGGAEFVFAPFQYNLFNHGIRLQNANGSCCHQRLPVGVNRRTERQCNSSAVESDGFHEVRHAISFFSSTSSFSSESIRSSTCTIFGSKSRLAWFRA